MTEDYESTDFKAHTSDRGNGIIYPMRCVDLFAGAGGFSAGLEKVGFKAIFAVEIDKNACKTFAANHPHAEVFDQNIADLKTEDLLDRLNLRREGELELLVGGPPCQGFSTVGKKDSGDPRNQLFRHYFRIVKALRPKFVVFENVTGFKRLYGGRAFEAVCEEFEKLDYNVDARILNAAHFGVPQLRQRTIVVGVTKGLQWDWPEPTHLLPAETRLSASMLKPALTLCDALSDLPVVKMGESSSEYAKPPQNDYQAERRAGSKMLLEQVGPNHGEKLLETISHVPTGGTIFDVPVRLRPRSYFGNTYSRLWWDRPSTTITRNLGTPSSSRCIHPLCDRGLTTREGARLQSFDDNFIFHGDRSSKNLQIGNAVPPLLAKAIGESVLAGLKGRREGSRQRRVAVASK